MLFRPGLTRIPFREKGEPRKAGRRLQRIELDLVRDRHSRAAIEAYADSCATDMPWLAGVLQEAATGGDNTGFTRCGETVRRVFNLAHAWAVTQPDYAPAAWDHVQIHLDAALSRRQALQDSEEGQERRGDDAARTGGDRFAGQPGNGRGQKTG
jgi:hypothetical protein